MSGSSRKDVVGSREAVSAALWRLEGSEGCRDRRR